MAEILFGTAGIPHSSKQHSSAAGIARIRELKLDAMELEFVYGVKMKEAEAKNVFNSQKENKVSLSVHAPYFINLNSKERAKAKASQQRILQSARIGKICGARIIVFHPGFYMGMPPKDAYNNVRKNLKEILAALKKEKNHTILGLETTGKPTQFGTLDEICQLCSELEQVKPTIDFSHLHARYNGCLKTQDDFEKILKTIKKHNSEFLKNLHMHASGIKYTAKGERNHLNLQDKNNDFNHKLMLKALKRFKVSGTIICESPNLEEGALLMQKYSKSID